MIHQLKTFKEYFDAVAAGTKTFEVRNNDRDFEIGDFLAMNEISYGSLTGRSILLEVTYILKGYADIADGVVVLGIKPCRIETCNDGYNMSHKTGMKIYGGKKI